MRKNLNGLLPIFLFIAAAAFFFWPTFTKGYIPFPGDLLVGNYEPYKSNSYFGWGPGGVPHKAQGPDVIRELYPWKFFAIENMRNGQLPGWNPYNFSGNPQLANFQTASFYPLNIIFFIFPFNFAWIIFIFIQPVLAGFFTYLFTKEIGLRRPAAFYAGLIFSFSSYLTVWMEYGNIGHAILWLPLALYLTEKLVKKNKAKELVLLVITMTLSILAGYIQGTIYLFGVVCFYFLYRFFQIKERKIINLFLFGLALTIPFILSLPQLLPTLELFQLSARDVYPKEEFLRLLSPLYYSVTTLAPDFFGNPATRNHWFWGTYIERVSYIGVIPLLLAVIAVQKRKNYSFWFFMGLAFISYLFSLNIFPANFILGFNLPIIATTVPTRILSLFCFAGAILSGIGLDHWLKERKIAKKTVIIFFSIYLILGVFTFLTPKISSQADLSSNLKVAQKNLILPTIFAFFGAGLVWLGILWQKKKNLFLILILILTILDLFYFFKKITPFSPKEFVYPQTPVMSFLKEKAGIDRFWGYGIASIETNFATQEKVFSTDGSDALHIKRYGELLAAAKTGQIPSRIPRRDANIISGYGADDLKNNILRKRIMNLLGVKYILHKNNDLGEKREVDLETFPQNDYQLVWQGGKWQVYENKGVLPRIFLSANYIVEKDGNKIIEKIFDGNFDLKTLILEEELPLKIDPAGQNGEVSLIKYSPNEIEVQTKTNSAQLLFLSDNYYPGWKAFIDPSTNSGQVEAKIYRAHYSFRAVVVPVGEHRVIFRYQPPFL